MNAERWCKERPAKKAHPHPKYIDPGLPYAVSELMLLKCSIKFCACVAECESACMLQAAGIQRLETTLQKQCVAKVVEAKHDVRHKHQSFGKLAVLLDRSRVIGMHALQ